MLVSLTVIGLLTVCSPCRTLGYLNDLAVRASRPENSSAVRLAGTELGGAVDDFLILIAETFLLVLAYDAAAARSRLTFHAARGQGK
jgi:hypothetical protein